MSPAGCCCTHGSSVGVEDAEPAARDAPLAPKPELELDLDGLPTVDRAEAEVPAAHDGGGGGGGGACSPDITARLWLSPGFRS